MKNSTQFISLHGIVNLKYLIKLLFLITISAIPLRAAGFVFLAEELPEDEHAALIELEEGLLDSTTWETLKPFYNQPLSVPLGELRYLQDIIPDLPDDLPTEAEILSLYEPWTEDNKAVFFKDYPYLALFKPILSFETEKMPSIAHVAFSSRLTGLSGMFRQSVRFTLTPGKQLRADGTVYFQEDYARWQRRRVLLKIPYLGKVQAGNFSFTMNRGLFYGYFPSSALSHDTLKYNWMYGESRSWNGFSSETSLGEKSALSTLFHFGKTESIAGLKAKFNPGSLLTFYTALSGAVSQLDSTANDTLIAIHGGITASMGSFTIKLESGTNLFNAGSIPVYLTLSSGERKHSFGASFIKIPRNFTAPRSSLLYSFRSRLEVNDSTNDPITGVDIAYSGFLSNSLKQVFHTSYITMENKANLKSSYTFTGSLPFEYSIYYGLDVYDLFNNVKHRLKVSTNHPIGSNFNISPVFLYDVRPNEYWRIMTNLQTGFKLFSTMDILPFINFNTDSKSHHNLAGGIIQRIAFFKKTFGELKLIVPIISYYNEKYSFYAKTHFLF